MTARPPRPTIIDAPGLTWRPVRHGWQARWLARRDLAKRGYRPTSQRIWTAKPGEPVPDELSIKFIQDRCQSLQSEMLIFGRGGLPVVAVYDDTLATLIRCYQTDQDSRYRKTRFFTRRYYDTLCRRIERDHGADDVATIKARHLMRWHEEWAEDGLHIPRAHALMRMLRSLFSFGMTILECEECKRLCLIMSELAFPAGKPRTAHLTAEQVAAIRAEARAKGQPSIALAQAFQFECTLRQKDVIGEWVPISEPGHSEITSGNDKWMRGLRWNEIGPDMVLRHVTSKRQKAIEIPLLNAPMVIEELGTTDRSKLPASGPIIVDERTGLPWSAHQFPVHWRKHADAVGVPKNVRNMDSRAGAITEAFDAGADADSVRKAATHSTLQMTSRYSRGERDAVAEVMQLRAAKRNNKRT